MTGLAHRPHTAIPVGEQPTPANLALLALRGYATRSDSNTSEAMFERLLAAVKADVLRNARDELAMIPCWANEHASEFDLDSESHRDTVLGVMDRLILDTTETLTPAPISRGRRP